VWDVEWAPGETKTIRCSYNMGEPVTYAGLVAGWGVHYVVRTGTLWRGGVIGKADISIRFESNVGSPSTVPGAPAAHPKGQEPSSTVYVSFPESAKWVSEREVRWHFESWTPREDISVKTVFWHGLDEPFARDYFYRLPKDYLGATTSYSDETLDQLVERELAPWRALFPEHCARFDRKKLRRIIADWLLHEILARHGDPFVVGKGELGVVKNPEAVMSMDGYLYGRWHTAFEGYMYHGGWYRPRMGAKGTVSEKTLGAQEQANLRFLRNAARP